MIKQDKLAALNFDVATALIQGAPLREVLLHCSEAFVHHLDAAFARIWTYNKEENVLELQASAGMYTHIDGSHSRVPVGKFKIGLIAEERKPHLTNAVIGDPRVHDQEWVKREGMAAFAGYPLVVEDRLVGVMGMFSRQQLSEATLQAMGTVAKQIALGIDQKQGEETLQESEKRFRQLAEHIREVFWCCSTDGHEVVYVSPAYEEIWGRTCQSLYDRPTNWIDAIHADDRERVSEAFFGKASQGNFDEEYRIVRPDGTIRWIRDRGFPVENESGCVYRIAGIAEDITDRILAEAALRKSHDELERRVQERTSELYLANTLLKESQRKYMELYDNAPDMFASVDQKTMLITQCNQTLAKQLGYSSEEIIGRPVLDLYHPDCMEGLDKAFELFAKTGEIRNAEFQLKQKDGTKIDVMLSVSAIRDKQGSILSNNSILRDISDHKRAETALRESEERVRLLLDSTAEAIYGIDLQGNCTFVNPACIQVLGYKDDNALLGKNIHNLIHHSRQDGTHYPIEECKIYQAFRLEEGTHVTDEVFWRPDGTSFPVEYRSFPVRRGSDIVGAVVTFVDITVRKRAEEQIESLAKFPEENPCPVFRTDKNGTVTYLNEASQVLLREWKMAVGRCITRPLLEVVSEALASGSNRAVDVQCGEQFYSFDVTPIREDNYVNLYGTDITERKQAEENLKRHAEELTRSNAELEQYAYIASHDLQEPLRGVAGCLRILERRYKDSLDASAHELITHAVDGSCRMQTLIEDLLRYSKVGTRNQHFEPTDCAKILNQTLTALDAPIQETGAVVTYDTLPKVSYDPTQLMQVFQNLISNALKFRREASPRIHVGAKRRDREWVLWVQDNGIGIKPEYAERIYVLFQRLHTRAKYSGTGIGLAICKKIVERHHGRIWFESDPRKGTTFFFTIPL